MAVSGIGSVAGAQCAAPKPTAPAPDAQKAVALAKSQDAAASRPHPASGVSSNLLDIKV